MSATRGGNQGQLFYHLAVIIPVLNEVQTLEQAVRHLMSSLDEMSDVCSANVIIVESGSTDGSEAVAQALVAEFASITLIHQPIANGKGNAVREGIAHASGDYMLIYDADLEYSPGDIPGLLDPLLEGSADFVLGTRPGRFRMRTFKSRPFLALTLNVAHVGFSLFLSCLILKYLRDPFTMYKVMRLEHVKRLHLVADRFDFDWELVIKSARSGARFVEVPVNYTSRSFDQGKKIRVLYDPLTWIFGALKFRFGKLYS